MPLERPFVRVLQHRRLRLRQMVSALSLVLPVETATARLYRRARSCPNIQGTCSGTRDGGRGRTGQRWADVHLHLQASERVRTGRSCRGNRCLSGKHGYAGNFGGRPSRGFPTSAQHSITSRADEWLLLVRAWTLPLHVRVHERIDEGMAERSRQLPRGPPVSVKALNHGTSFLRTNRPGSPWAR